MDELHSDWPWLRPTLTFLLGLLVGVVLIAAVRPALPNLDEPSRSPASTACDRLAADSSQLASLANRAKYAAERHDSAGLADLQRALTESQRAFMQDLPACQD